ncbi:MAG: hypothetical protein JWL92_500, partial [Candidatus Nomurabacteria bacterium]|nr:hypothetical protein [Candidatus Nomurabacteria bacterium]
KDAILETTPHDTASANSLAIVSICINSFGWFVILSGVIHANIPYHLGEEYSFEIMGISIILGWILSFLYGPSVKAMLSLFFRVKM